MAVCKEKKTPLCRGEETSRLFFILWVSDREGTVTVGDGE